MRLLRLRHLKFVCGTCLLACALLLGGVPGAHSEQITVFAAASLKNALDEISDGYGATNPDTVTLTYAGSSTLARQIEFGAPADIFISANLDWMDRLDAENLIARDTRRDIAGNALVLIAGQNQGGALELTQDVNLSARLESGRLAMALVDAVPAGIYGKSALVHLGLWDKIAAQVAQTDSARAALALVASGAAPLGIVYASDAMAEPRVSVIAHIPPHSHPEIRYPAAALTGRDTAATLSFLDYLHSETAKNILTRQGFVVLTE